MLTGPQKRREKLDTVNCRKVEKTWKDIKTRVSDRELQNRIPIAVSYPHDPAGNEQETTIEIYIREHHTQHYQYQCRTIFIQVLQ